MYFTIPRLIFTLLFIYFLYCTWILADDRLPYPKKFFHNILGWHEPERNGYFLHKSDEMKARCQHCGKFIKRNKDGIIWKFDIKIPAVDIRENPRARFEIKTRRRKSK